MGKTIKLSLNSRDFTPENYLHPTQEKESRSERKKKKEKELSQKTQRTRENKTLQDAVNRDSLENLAMPIKKNTML